MQFINNLASFFDLSNECPIEKRYFQPLDWYVQKIK
jgi:hypothetical protein